MQTLLASGARTASGTSSVPDPIARLVAAATRGIFQLEVTAAATDVGDTLNVYIQHSVDGSIWDDFVSFTQVLGNGGAKKYLASWLPQTAPGTAQAAPSDGALAAGVKHGPIGANLRIKYSITDAGTANASFTFSVKAQVVGE